MVGPEVQDPQHQLMERPQMTNKEKKKGEDNRGEIEVYYELAERLQWNHNWLCKHNFRDKF